LSNNASSKKNFIANIVRATAELNIAMASAQHVEFGHADIGLSDLRALRLIETSGPQLASAIASAVGITAASATSLIDRLEAKGLVQRVRDPNDRRQVHVHLTLQYARRISSKSENRKRSLADLLSKYSAQELGVIADYLQKNIYLLGKPGGK